MKNAFVFERDNLDKSMYDYVREYSSYGSNRAALTYFGKDIAFDTFVNQSEAVAHVLLNLGVQAGDSVTVCLPNIPQAVYAIYGANRAGAVINIVHPAITFERLSVAVNDTGSQILFITREYYFKSKQKIDGLKLKKVILCAIADDMPKITGILHRVKNRGVYLAKAGGNAEDYIAAVSPTQVLKPLPKISGEAPAVYMHSGGTTGVPKTVVLSNKNLNALTYNLMTSIEEGDRGYTYSTSDVMYGVLPFFHGYGLGVCLHSCLAAGIKVSLQPKFSVDGFIKSLKRDKLTVMAALPNMYRRILADKRFCGDAVKSLKNAYVGSEKMPEEIKSAFDIRMYEAGADCRLEEGYGLSETVNVCLLNRNKTAKDYSVGKPLLNCAACVVDGENVKLESNISGELCICADSVMAGYLNDEETTKAVKFTDDAGNTWLKTGDLAHIDEEGFVYYEGRIKRVTVISGMNIFPIEIEDCARALPFVSDACAVETENEEGKPEITLFVVTDKIDDRIIAEIKYQIRSKLSHWHEPRHIVKIDELPLSPLGKVDYKTLQQRAAEAYIDKN